MIEFISHEFFHDDQYTKEICYLSIDNKFRFAYVRKMKKDGGLFWSHITLSVNINGEKKYRSSIEWDSNFLAKDILAFLDARSWENKHSTQLPKQQPYSQQSFMDSTEPPF